MEVYGIVLHHYLDEGIIDQLLSTHSCCSRETLRAGLYRTMEALRCHVPSWQNRSWRNVGGKRQEMEQRVFLHEVFDGDVKSCLTATCYVES
jgi:hypothetical protein